MQTLGEKIQWLESLLEWIRIPSSPDNTRVVSHIQSVRVRFFLQTLERNPAWRGAVSDLLVSVLLETDSVSLLCEAGLNTGYGFFSEATERLAHRILPAPRNEKNLSELFSRIFVDESDADWLESLDEPTLNALAALLFQAEKSRPAIEKHYQAAISEALIILASHLESLGLSADVRLRSHVKSVRCSAFYRLRTALSHRLADRDRGAQHFHHRNFKLRRELRRRSLRGDQSQGSEKQTARNFAPRSLGKTEAPPLFVPLSHGIFPKLGAILCIPLAILG
jgi:site-specific recombinase